MQHVQNSEEDLEKKRKHCTLLILSYEAMMRFFLTLQLDVDVVKAFESALALLNDRIRP